MYMLRMKQIPYQKDDEVFFFFKKSGFLFYENLQSKRSFVISDLKNLFSCG